MPALVLVTLRLAWWKMPFQFNDGITIASHLIMTLVSSMYHSCDTHHSHGVLCHFHCLGFNDYQLRIADMACALLATHSTILLNWSPSRRSFAVIYMLFSYMLIPIGSALLVDEKPDAMVMFGAFLIAADLVTRGALGNRESKQVYSKPYVPAICRRSSKNQQQQPHGPVHTLLLQMIPMHSMWDWVFLFALAASVAFGYVLDYTDDIVAEYGTRHALWHAVAAVAGTFGVLLFARPTESMSLDFTPSSSDKTQDPHQRTILVG
jgi:hypothetical protein